MNDPTSLTREQIRSELSGILNWLVQGTSRNAAIVAERVSAGADPEKARFDHDHELRKTFDRLPHARLITQNLDVVFEELGFTIFPAPGAYSVDDPQYAILRLGALRRFVDAASGR